MTKNLLDVNQWANPRMGEMVLDALFAPLPRYMNEYFLPVGMSAEELLKTLVERGYAQPGYFVFTVKEDGTLRVGLDLHIEGASPCSYGYLENRIAEITAFYHGKCFHAKTL
jgi:hypothetical protein